MGRLINQRRPYSRTSAAKARTRKRPIECGRHCCRSPRSTAGLHSRTEPRGQDEKGAMAGTRVEPSKTNHGEITLDLSAAAGPAAGERQEDDQGRQEDRETDGGGDGWEQGGRDGAGTSPAGALAHLPCCHTNGDTIRVGLKDGGGRFFFFPPLLRGKPGERGGGR